MSMLEASVILPQPGLVSTRSYSLPIDIIPNKAMKPLAKYVTQAAGIIYFFIQQKALGPKV